MTGEPLIGSVRRFPLSVSADSVTFLSSNFIFTEFSEVFLLLDVIRLKISERITDIAAIGIVTVGGSMFDDVSERVSVPFQILFPDILSASE